MDDTHPDRHRSHERADLSLLYRSEADRHLRVALGLCPCDPLSTIPEGLTSLTVESCGTCHTEIDNDWKPSIHSYAYKDPCFHALAGDLAKQFEEYRKSAENGRASLKAITLTTSQSRGGRL